MSTASSLFNTQMQRQTIYVRDSIYRVTTVFDSCSQIQVMLISNIYILHIRNRKNHHLEF
jgi:hypothetical protein